tara:strand:- start:3179 stop:3391 length:213 start_codon:yes stop_codon:yes gene_type:complete
MHNWRSQDYKGKQDHAEAQGEIFLEYAHTYSPFIYRGGPRIDRFALSALSTNLSPAEKIKSAGFTARNRG